MEDIPILRVIVGKKQVKMEQKKIKAIKEQKTLTKIKDKKVFWNSQTFTRDLSSTSVIQQDY